MENKAISGWPDEDRPREKLLKKGPEALTTSELLAIFLRTGIRGKNAVQLGRDLIRHFNGIRGVFSASEHDLCSVPGIGKGKAATIKAVAELNRRFIRENLEKKDAVHCPAEVYQLLMSELRDRDTEQFKVLFLNSRNEILGDKILFTGTIDSSPVYPREVIRQAISHGATSIIIVHNHPSGSPEPSRHDREITDKILQAARMMDIKLADHIIIGDNRFYSFAQTGSL